MAEQPSGRGAVALLRRGLCQLVASALGVLTAALSLAGLTAAGAAVVLAWPWAALRRPARRLGAGLVAGLARLERYRLSALLNTAITPEAHIHRQLGYLLLRLPLAGAAALVLPVGLMLLALLWGGVAVELAGAGTRTVQISLPGVTMSASTVNLGLATGLLVLAGLWLAVALQARAERRLARWFLGPSTTDLMARRIDELTETRQGVVRAVDEERRRIERDLHDGVQQRVVALAMLLARARRRGDDSGGGAERTRTLLDQAHEESRRLVEELRDVAWNVYPTALDELGLRAALEHVAERAGLPVILDYRLAGRLAPEVETALYFVAREAITNAAKHARAGAVSVEVAAEGEAARVRVRDDGAGGADAAGAGLAGLARRVAALDGTLSVHSPTGGPTTVTALLPRQGARPAPPRGR